MSGSETGAAPPAERTAWLRDLRRVDARQEDDLAGDFDTQWGEIEPIHQGFVERFLSRLPPDGQVLDAACGTDQHDLQDLPYQGEFDGVLCVDAMEFVPPEDWPPVLERFRRALRPRGWLYLTVELAPADRVRAANQAARRRGLPVVDGEVIWEGPDGYYHHYPSMQRVRTWLAGAGFAIQEEAEGPWHEQGYAYHHLLARGRG